MNNSIENKEISPARVIAVSVLVLASSVAMLAGIAIFFSRHFFVSELLNNFRLQIGSAIVVLGIILFCVSMRKFAMLQLTVGVAVLYPILVNLLPAQQIAPGPKVISLLSYNVLGDNQDKKPIVNLLASTEADITVVIEYANNWVEALKPLKEANLYSLEAPRWHGFGIAIFSRYELQNERVAMLSKSVSDFPFLLAEVVIGKQRLILAAGHFLAPMSPDRMEIRNQQIASATRLINNYRNGRDLPIVVVGDMNAVAWSPFVNDMMYTVELRDSRQGFLYEGSWPNDNMLLRIPIDNALVSKHVHVHHRKLLDCYSSDHLPLLLDFSIVAPD